MDSETGEEATPQTIEREITRALGHAEACGNTAHGRSRENSLVQTKLQEAQMWNTRDIQKKEAS